MFMRMITDEEQLKDSIPLYLPRILDLLLTEQEMLLTVECLTVVERLGKLSQHAFLLMPYQSRVFKINQTLLVHRKRVVRKFARVVINAWS